MSFWLLIASCGSSNDVDSTDPVPGAPSQNGLLSYNSNIQVGKFAVVESPKTIESSSQKKCFYKIKTRVDITDVSIENDLIELKIRKTEKERRGNSRSCPSQYGVNENTIKTYSYKKILETYDSRVKDSLDPSHYCRRNKWCKSAKLQYKGEASYNGHKVIYTKMKIKSKRGQTYQRKAWVSKDNLFLNTLGFEIKRWNTNEVLDYKKTLDF